MDRSRGNCSRQSSTATSCSTSPIPPNQQRMNKMNTYEKFMHHAKGARHVAGMPKRITPAIEAFCAAINGDAEPVYLPVTPTPTAEPAKCFRNVSEVCQEAG